MEKFNGKELFELMENCIVNDIKFLIEKRTIQGLEGIYLIVYDDFIKVNNSYVNCVLIEEL